MQIGDICTHRVVTIDKTASIFDAAKLMRAEHVGDLVVVDSDAAQSRPLGIVTDRDLVVELLAKNVELDSVAVGDVASARTVTARADGELLDTLKLMSVKGVRRVPVVDDDGNLVGILSANDVLGVAQDMLARLRDLDSRRVARERSTRE